MRGQVLTFDAASGAGWISGEDGVRYSFTTADLAAPVPAHPGAQLDFLPVGGVATRILAAPGQAPIATSPASSGMFSPVTPDPVGEPSLGVFGYIRRCFRKYADFNGRARRKEYWSFYLLVMILIMPLYVVQVAFAIAVSASGGSGSGGSANDGLSLGLAMVSLGISLVLMLIVLALLLPQYAVTVRRLHDIGVSGWWILAGIVPILGLALIVVPFMPSQPGANIYGGYPKPVT